jgi:sec-independent protein translocase protein TatA
MGMSAWHMILLLIIVMVFFGPSRLPGLGKSMGEAIRGFKKGLGGDEDEREVTRREELREKSAAEEAQKKTETKDRV